MGRVLRWLGIGVAAVLAAAALWLWAVPWGGIGRLESGGAPAPARLPADAIAARAAAQREALAAAALGAAPEPEQILFGDLHVHTTFSSDAFLFSLPLVQGEGAHPPADACDYARFCAQLDFFSLNDHAELLTPRQWRETRQTLRDCAATAGGDADADVIPLLGFEWTQMGSTPANHYGHKNVIFRDLAEGAVPTRPIDSGRGMFVDLLGKPPPALRVMIAGSDPAHPRAYADFFAFSAETGAVPDCPANDDPRAIPDDCRDHAPTPAELFAKLDAWGFPSLVIPHGTAWGIHSPPGSEIASQLPQTDPDRERLFEVYSGHGSSEVHAPWRHVAVAADGSLSCPAPSDGFEPCCWRAGELIRARCADPAAADCDARAAEARQRFVDAGYAAQRFGVVPGATPEEWGECGQLPGGFLPAYTYRPGMSAQAALAASALGPDGAPRRFRFGLIGSSDTHKARPGNGYKERARLMNSDAWGWREDVVARAEPARGARSESSRALADVPFGFLFLPERGASFYYTSGLVAVHARGRSREALWDALERREVYGTSGPRILLWFDLENAPGGQAAMGSELALAEAPQFHVRAVGAREELPGCPADAERGLSADRLERLCAGECHHPGDRRTPIERVEVVRIRAQRQADEPLASLIEDPWRSFDCPADAAGCEVRFTDPEFAGAGRETVYYVRALQAPTPAINGDPLRCERDAAGACVRPRPCYASGPDADPPDDCLAPVAERAWSSPFFLTPAEGDPG